MSRRLLAVVAVAVAVAAWAADRPGRVPLTTSKFTGSPETPPAYRVVNAFPKLKFDKPLHLAAVPGTNRLAVCEQGGRIFTFPNRPDVSAADLLLDVKADAPGVKAVPNGAGFENLYAVAFHPKFAENRQCFVCYTVRGKAGPNLPDGTHVSRFAVSRTDPPRIDPASEEVVLAFLQGGHNGCDLRFGPDGMLYISTGDAASPTPPDPLHTGQDVSDLLSSVLRIDVDRKDAGKNYAVPPDNPFVGQRFHGKPARGEVWAFGFRNPWRMSFDRKTGDLWVGDVGWELWELIHRVEKGGNYGWSLVEGRQPVNPSDPPGPGPVRPPVIELPHTVAASVTGGFVYRGKKLPDLVGAYVFGDWQTRRIWAARTDGDRLKSLAEIVAPSVRVVAFGEDHAGELLIVDHDAGTILALAPNPATAAPSPFPRTLSVTGLFASVKDHAPAPGVVRFEPTARQWLDGATSEHLLALPGASSVMDVEGKKPLPNQADWMAFRYHFPKDAVLLRTLSLETERGNPATRRRVETQALHWDGTDWRAYTFAWRDDQTDADLVPADGSENTFTVRDPRHAAGVREQTWVFASRTQCLQCHNPWAEYALAFNRDQLNRPVSTPAGERNQLDWLAELGVLARSTRDGKPLPPNTPTELAKFPKLTDPHDATAPADVRARSYLHANCAHCHRFGGGGSVALELPFDKPAKDLKALGVPPAQGAFDIPDAKIVAPGEPGRSTLVYRMAKFGRGRMPHLGSELPDSAGVRLVADWVRSLDPEKPAPAADFVSVPGAIALSLRDADRSATLAAAAKLPPGPVRDLFDGDLPRTGGKKLGPNPRPQAVLALAGDPGRGGALLTSSRVQCLNCHKLDGKGQDVGPDLSAAGKDRTREELLESLLDPSRRVEAKFQAYLLRTADGRALTGVLVKRDGVAVVLRDGQGKEVRVPAEDVESLQPARDSLMPAGLLADLTAQDAADLLAFLASRK